jgi:Domain of unknown function (DUF4177)
MAKEYKTLIYKDNEFGHSDMAADIERFAKEGWEIQSKEVVQQGFSFGKTCCLGCIFLPLALLGKKDNSIQVILQRDKVEEEQTINEEQNVEEGQQ